MTNEKCVDETNAEKISKFLEEFECAVISRTHHSKCDKKMYGAALILRYAVGVTEDAYVFVNVGKKTTFFENSQKLAKVFNQESIIVKDAGTQDAYRLLCDGEKIAVGKFISNIALNEIAEQVFNPFGMPMNYANEEIEKNAIRLCLDSWQGRNNLGKWCISIVCKDVMEKLRAL